MPRPKENPRNPDLLGFRTFWDFSWVPCGPVPGPGPGGVGDAGPGLAGLLEMLTAPYSLTLPVTPASADRSEGSNPDFLLLLDFL